MGYMFEVCSARAPIASPPPTTPSRLPGRTASRIACPHRMPAPHAPLSTRQGALAFNQPLSFDTSKVTHMWKMFFVRALPPQS